MAVMEGPQPYENINGYWAVGYAANVGGSPGQFTLYTESASLYGPGNTLNCLYTNRGGSAGDVPNFCQNIGNTSYKGVDPGQIALTPYTGAYEFSILRWVAPRAGAYDITSSFFQGELGVTVAEIYVDGVLLYNLGDTPAFYETRVDLRTNAIVDFVVGPGAEFLSDITPLDVLIKDVRCAGYTG